MLVRASNAVSDRLRSTPDVIVGLLRPRGEHAAIGGHRLRGIALAGIRQLRDFLLPKSTMASPRGVETATQPVCLPSVDGACNVASTLQADIRAALRPEHLAAGYDRRLADDGERFDMRGALDRRILARVFPEVRRH